MIISKKVFKRNNSLTTEANYTQGRSHVYRSEVASELFNRGLIDYDVNELDSKRRQRKLYSLGKTEKFAKVEAELNAELTTTIVENELVGEMKFIVDGRASQHLIEQCINSALVGLPQLNPMTNKPVIQEMGWINKVA